MKRICVVIVCMLASIPLSAQETVRLSSPDGNIGFTFRLAETPVYNVTFKEKVLVGDSPLTLEFDDGQFGKNLTLGKTVFRTGDETYDLVVGKAKHVHSHYKEVLLPLKEQNAPFREVRIVVRAFDDGIAFRYEFPEQSGKSSFILYDENTTFNLSGNPLVLTTFKSNYVPSRGGIFTRLRLDEIKPGRRDKLMEMPVLFEYPEEKVYLSITEANLVDYAGLWLSKEDNGLLRGKLSPYRGQPQVKVKAALPHKSPWRVLMISDRMGALIESNILTNLAAPCKVEDTSWLKPGKTTWMWWNGDYVPDYIREPGNNFQTHQYYIDWCADNKIQYHSVIGYADKPWYTDDGGEASPGPNFDITKPVKTIDMKKICDYAKSKGVGIMVWVHCNVLYAKLDEAFALFEQWGVKGMMIDFMDRDDQEMIRMQEEFLAKAAKHHLYVQFHGASKPSGIHRTYPNEFTREAGINHEFYKDHNIVNADHDLKMPFTQLLAGTCDYHLGGFRAVPQSEFKMHWTLPFVTSTRCHMLAMYVVLESYLHMAVDAPPRYEGQVGFEWIQKVPTVWDETRVPNAEVEEYVTIARKKDNEWWAGTINNHEARNIKVPLDFLDEGDYTAEIYTDAPDVDTNPNHLVKQIKTVSKKDVLDLSLAANGGAAVHFKKSSEAAKSQAAFEAYLNETSPFPKNPYNITKSAPFILGAADFDLGALGTAFNRSQTMQDADGSQINYRTDNGGTSGLKYGIVNVGNTGLKGFGMTTLGDWYVYSVNVVDAGVYKIEVNQNSGGKIPWASLTIDNENVLRLDDFPLTGWHHFQWYDTRTTVYLPAGKHKLKYTLRGNSPHNLGGLRFTYVQP
ncbi:alpha-glucosidase [Planctomycetales bacterium]|nr:alpha-glucosidase [Planctomycetales bacterium]